VSFAADLRAVLRHRDFRRLYATRLTSQASDGIIFQVALASYVFFTPERHTSAEQAAAAFATLLLPYSLVGPFAGVLLDRWRRRQVLVRANVLRAAAVCGVATLVATGRDRVEFYVAALAVLSVNRFYLAALSAALPHVVHRHELVMANSVSTTSGTIATVVGAGVGFAVRRVVGHGAWSSATIIALAAGTYLLASLAARTMHRDLLGPEFDPERPQTREALRRVAVGLVDGARHVWHRRAAGHALAAIATHRFLYGVLTIATILLYRNHFNDPRDVDAGMSGLAIAFAAAGIGFFVAALVTPIAAARVGTRRWIVLCFAAAVVVVLALGAPYTEPTLVALAFLLGIVSQGVKICVDTIVQETVDDPYRGRVFSFYDVLFNVSFVSAAAFAALALPSNGKSPVVLVLIAVGYGLAALVYERAVRRTSVTSPTGGVSHTGTRHSSARSWVGRRRDRSGERRGRDRPPRFRGVSAATLPRLRRDVGRRRGRDLPPVVRSARLRRRIRPHRAAGRSRGHLHVPRDARRRLVLGRPR
jgi:MFS family permease